MNRIELAAANAIIEPLVIDGPAIPVATPIALVGVGLAAAALGYQVGFHLGGSLEDAEALLTTGPDGGASSSELLALRRSAVSA